ncbi:MAG: hypothetical protein IIB99_12225, partial [Planctomycetes bacterium]|nr:hypothetical protein [Planctomycetota bacterium]
MNDRADSPSQVATLQAKVVDLAQTIAELQAQRETLIRKRRRKLLLVGVAVSLAVHLGLLAYLDLVNRGLSEGRSSPPVAIEFATLHEQELIQPEKIEFDDLLGELTAELDDLPQAVPTADLPADVSAGNLGIS